MHNKFKTLNKGKGYYEKEANFYDYWNGFNYNKIIEIKKDWNTVIYNKYHIIYHPIFLFLLFFN